MPSVNRGSSWPWSDPDIDLEQRILAAYHHCLKVWNREAWLELARLIKLRSPRQVEKMERERGLE